MRFAMLCEHCRATVIIPEDDDPEQLVVEPFVYEHAPHLSGDEDLVLLDADDLPN